MEILQLWAAGLECWPVFTLEKDPGDPDVPLNVFVKGSCSSVLPLPASGQEFTGKQWRVMDRTLL